LGYFLLRLSFLSLFVACLAKGAEAVSVPMVDSDLFERGCGRKRRNQKEVQAADRYGLVLLIVSARTAHCQTRGKAEDAVLALNGARSKTSI